MGRNMWKLIIYVTCVVILFPNAYGCVDYTSYLLSRLTEHINQVNHLLKMIYKLHHYQNQSDGDALEINQFEHDYIYENALMQTMTALKNVHRAIMKLKIEQSSTGIYSQRLPYQVPMSSTEYDLDRTSGLKKKLSGRRSAKSLDFSDNFYAALAGAFKKFLAFNPNVKSQLGDDFNADALINPPVPEKK